MEEKLNHKCGIFGVYARGMDVARLTYFGLYALQHRGQESSGIAVSNGKKIVTHKRIGLVAQVYAEDDLKKLRGYIAIGHNRYSTSGGIHDAHMQPVAQPDDIVALAHNGNLPVIEPIKKFLSSHGISTHGHNDSELMQLLLKFYLVKGMSIEEAVKKSFPLFTGSFCLLILTKDKLVAVRDTFGIRPLSIGKLNGGYVVSSETCAIDTVSAHFVRDVAPGEMVVFSSRGMVSHMLSESKQKLDIFEFVYFARPDSVLLGQRVHEVRKNLGRLLAQEVKVSADVVIPVPDSSIPAAIGFSEESSIPFDFGLVKNRYIGRTFIMPEQRLRDHSVQMKLNPVKSVIEGKRIVVIDDSIVRGTTLKKLVTMLRHAGAKKVHILSSCPPVCFPDFYGIDTPSQKELIASQKTVSEIEKFIGADSLHYLSYKGLISATNLPEEVFCTSCFTGDYPIDIGKQKNYIKIPKAKIPDIAFKTFVTNNKKQSLHPKKSGPSMHTL